MEKEKKICQCCKLAYDGRIRNLIEDDEYISHERLCILHAKNEIKDLELFKKSLKDVIEKINKSFENNLPWDNYFFNDIYFPENFSFSLFLSEENLKDNINIFFDNCIFYDIKFSNRECKNLLEFRKCKIENIEIENIIFDGKFKLKYSVIKKYALFKSCKFNKLADFYGTKFEDVSFEDSRFYKMTVFSEITVENSIDFKYTYFFDVVHFREMILKNASLDFIATTFDKAANFLNIKSDRNEIIKNRETARIIKDSFEQQNNIIEANKFYALEMKEREKELSFFKEPLEWLVFKIHGISSNHSQDWFLSLLWIIIISFIVGLFNQKYYFEWDRYVFINIILFIPLFIGFKFDNIKRKIGLSLFLIIFYCGTSINLDYVSNLINPFSIMTKGEDLNFTTLFYKITIAYLIYQLIISIRQNTRRK
jgi:uncharacterized protein YjbI with pentapeptide repeats